MVWLPFGPQLMWLPPAHIVADMNYLHFVTALQYTFTFHYCNTFFLHHILLISSFILFFHLFVFLLTIADQCIDLFVVNTYVYLNLY